MQLPSEVKKRSRASASSWTNQEFKLVACLKEPRGKVTAQRSRSRQLRRSQGVRTVSQLERAPLHERVHRTVQCTRLTRSSGGLPFQRLAPAEQGGDVHIDPVVHQFDRFRSKIEKWRSSAGTWGAQACIPHSKKCSLCE